MPAVPAHRSFGVKRNVEVSLECVNTDLCVFNMELALLGFAKILKRRRRIVHAYGKLCTNHLVTFVYCRNKPVRQALVPQPDDVRNVA